MYHKPLISIVIPMYNAEKYIQETINSVIQQTYENWEMLIVDNYSTDKSKEIVQKNIIKENKIKLIELEYNSGGPARPRNIGIDNNAKGKYIAFLDADDMWVENKLELQINFMLNNNIDFSSTNYELIDENSKKIDTTISFSPFFRKIYSKNYTLNKSLFYNIISTSTVMIKSEVIKKYGFNEEKNLVGVEDYFLWCCLLNDKIIYSYYPMILEKYRISNNSISREKKYISRYKQVYCITKFCIENNIKFNIFYRLLLFFRGIKK